MSNPTSARTTVDFAQACMFVGTRCRSHLCHMDNCIERKRLRALVAERDTARLERRSWPPPAPGTHESDLEFCCPVSPGDVDVSVMSAHCIEAIYAARWSRLNRTENT